MKKKLGLKTTGEVLRPEDITWERISDGLRAKQIPSSAVIGFSVGISSCQAILDCDAVYDRSICHWLKKGSYGEHLARELMAEDAENAADQLLPIFKRTSGVDGWVMLPTSPLLPSETTAMVEAVLALYREVRRPNVLISIPGLQDRLPALEKLFTLGIPLNAGLIFSVDQFQAVALAYRNACEARLAGGGKSASACFTTIPVDRLIAGLSHFLPDESAVEASIAITAEIAQAAQKLRFSEPWQRFSEAGGQPPRLVWTLEENRSMSRLEIPADGRQANRLSLGGMTGNNKASDFFGKTFTDGYQKESPSFYRLEHTGINFTTIADRLQKDEAETSIRAWIRLLDSLARKSAALATGDCTQHKKEDR